MKHADDDAYLFALRLGGNGLLRPMDHHGHDARIG